MSKKYDYNPDYCSPPGDTIEELMEYYEMSAYDLGEKLCLSESETRKLLSGELNISDKTAEKLNSVFGPSKSFWISRENIYRDFLSKHNNGVK